MTYAATARCDDGSRGRSHFSFALVSSAALCAVAVASGVSVLHLRSPARAPLPVRVADRVPVVVHTWAVERPRVAPQAAGAPDPAAIAAAAHALSTIARSRAETLPGGPVPANRQVASIDPSTISQPSAAARIASAQGDAAGSVGADANPARIVPQVPAIAAPVEPVPLPRPRPAFLAPPRDEALPREELAPPQERDEAPRRPGRRRLAREVPGAPAAKEPEDQRNPLEKLFGLPQSSKTTPTTATAYAPSDGGLGGLFGRKPAASYAPSTGLLDGLFGGKKPSSSGGGGGTAIYDISAHTVYLPDGRRLEAHSGLGSLLDDPNRVNTPNRGATPPAVYDLSVRETAFHGVRALRLNPVGGGSTYGRNGLLAHTYMLGPRGDSNGCVVFRDYDTFLQAFESGAVRRLEVVARR